MTVGYCVNEASRQLVTACLLCNLKDGIESTIENKGVYYRLSFKIVPKPEDE
jgi:hypothetical protein